MNAKIRLFAAAALTVLVATPAMAQDKQEQTSFTRAGKTYTYTTRVNGDVTMLTGSDGSTNFALQVRHNHVTGYYGASDVDFMTSDVKQTLASLAD